MRHVATLFLGIALLAPAVAGARSTGSAECRYLSSKIEFFESRAERARQLGNELWEERLGNHLAMLEKRRAGRCPGYGDGAAAMQALERLIELAAKGALTFFTMGAL